MRRFIGMLLCLCLGVALAACGTDKGRAASTATVLEAYDSYVLVEPEEGDMARRSAGRIEASTRLASGEDAPELQPGDRVQIHTVYAIYLLDENGNVQP